VVRSTTPARLGPVDQARDARLLELEMAGEVAAEIPELTVNAHAVALREVESAWSAPTATGQRVVFTP
jgi:hypothetical protein